MFHLILELLPNTLQCSFKAEIFIIVYCDFKRSESIIFESNHGWGSHVVCCWLHTFMSEILSHPVLHYPVFIVKSVCLFVCLFVHVRVCLHPLDLLTNAGREEFKRTGRERRGRAKAAAPPPATHWGCRRGLGTHGEGILEEMHPSLSRFFSREHMHRHETRPVLNLHSKSVLQWDLE